MTSPMQKPCGHVCDCGHDDVNRVRLSAHWQTNPVQIRVSREEIDWSRFLAEALLIIRESDPKE